jgi:hypothetical protein
MFNHSLLLGARGILPSGLLAGIMSVSPVFAQPAARAAQAEVSGTLAERPDVAANTPAGKSPVADSRPRTLRQRRHALAVESAAGADTSAALPATAPTPKAAVVEHAAVGKPPLVNAPTATPAARSFNARFHPVRFSRRAQLNYNLIWGVDSLSVKSVESGEIIRFAYRVLEPAKAQTLNDKRAEPSLIDPRAGVSLVIPSLEKVGKLRQSSTPVAGKSYWMAFSNKRRLVKRGDHVNVVIGQFRADGLVVE